MGYNIDSILKTAEISRNIIELDEYLDGVIRSLNGGKATLVPIQKRRCVIKSKCSKKDKIKNSKRVKSKRSKKSKAKKSKKSKAKKSRKSKSRKK